MASWDLYESAGSWGDEQITSAASGHPNGFSPVFWIAVRLNIHITRKCMGIASESEELDEEDVFS
jgi:hypothetical protein